MNANSTMDEIRVVLENTNSYNGWLSSLTTCLITIVSGVVVFIIGQYLFSMWILPLQKYKELRQKISFCLTYYAQYYSNVIDNRIDTLLPKVQPYLTGADEIRKLASELRGFSETISWFHIGIPKKEILFDTSANLIGLSNSFFAAKDCIQITNKHNQIRTEKIRKNLEMQSE